MSRVRLLKETGFVCIALHDLSERLLRYRGVFMIPGMRVYQGLISWFFLQARQELHSGFPADTPPPWPFMFPGGAAAPRDSCGSEGRHRSRRGSRDPSPLPTGSEAAAAQTGRAALRRSIGAARTSSVSSGGSRIGTMEGPN